MYTFLGRMGASNDYLPPLQSLAVDLGAAPGWTTEPGVPVEHVSQARESVLTGVGPVWHGLHEEPGQGRLTGKARGF